MTERLRRVDLLFADADGEELLMFVVSHWLPRHLLIGMAITPNAPDRPRSIGVRMDDELAGQVAGVLKAGDVHCPRFLTVIPDGRGGELTFEAKAGAFAAVALRSYAELDLPPVSVTGGRDVRSQLPPRALRNLKTRAGQELRDVVPVGWVGERLYALQDGKAVGLVMAPWTRAYLSAMHTARGYYLPQLLPDGPLARKVSFAAEYEVNDG
jgi:hypothetical protein